MKYFILFLLTFTYSAFSQIDSIYVIEWELQNCNYAVVVNNDSTGIPSPSIADSMTRFDDMIQYKWQWDVDSLTHIINPHQPEFYHILFYTDTTLTDTLYENYVQIALFLSSDTCFIYPNLISIPSNVIIRKL